jgi:hypothetical protein
MRQFFKPMLTAAVVLAFAAAAQAGTINGVIAAVKALNGGSGELVYNLNDLDRTIVEDNGDGVFGVGDRIKGTFTVDEILVGFDGISLGVGGTPSLFGQVYAEIASINTTTGEVSFKAVSGWATASNALFTFYENSNGDTPDNSSSTAGFADSVFSDAATSLWAEAGLTTGASYKYMPDFATLAGYDNDANSNFDSLDATEWGAEGRNGFDVNDLLYVPAGATIATASNISLDWVTKPLTGIGDTSVIGLIGTFADGFEIDGTSGTGIFGDTDKGKLASQASFRTPLTVVPTPAAVWSGFMLFAALGLGRVVRRRKIG